MTTTRSDKDVRMLLTCAGFGPPVPAEGQGVDVGELLAHAIDQRVAPWLCVNLVDQCPDWVSRSYDMIFRRYLDARRAASATGLAQLAQIIAAMTAAGVKAVPFKGPVLAQLAYDDPALRLFGDLDLLVDPAQAERALAVLERLGYRTALGDLTPGRLRAYHRYNGQDILFATGKLPVEPHWAPAPRSLVMQVDVSAMIDRAGSIIVGGHILPCLSVEDCVLLLALQAAKDQWRRVQPAQDLAALAVRYPLADWDIVLIRANQSGLRRAVLMALLLAADLFRAPIPGDLLALARHDIECRALVQSVRERLGEPVGESVSVFRLTRFHWRLRERRRDRLEYALRTLTLARVRHFRAVALPEALASLYPLVRIGHDVVALPLWLRWKRWQADRGSAQQ